MSKTVIQYKVLISAPSDIKQESEIRIITQAIDKFNRMIGDKYNMMILPRHWREDSYPEAGDIPQNLLNKQLVDECDAIIAIFWTRFGTPTEYYESGTVEEIMRLMDSGKQIFLYFSSIQIKPDEVNFEQFAKVNAFKEKYKDKGIYYSYDTLNEFAEKLDKHITKYFLTISKEGDTIQNKPDNLKSIIKLNLYTENGIEDKLVFQQSNFISSKYITERNEEAKQLAYIIDGIEIDESEPIAKSDSLYKPLALVVSEGMNQYVKISKEKIKKIEHFFKLHNINVSSNFFNLGNLKEPKVQLVSVLGGFGSSLSGTDSEKEKYKKINEMYSIILEIISFKDYFQSIDNLYFMDIVISNIGQNVDRNIDIKLFIEKGKVINYEKLPIPKYPAIEVINNFGVEHFVVPQKSHLVKEYVDYPKARQFVLPPEFNIHGKSIAEIIREEQDNYLSSLKRWFCYETFTTNDYDVIKLNLSYIKHNENVFFPTKLFFIEKANK